METDKKKISIISPCYNEEENIIDLYRRVSSVMAGFPQYEYDYLFIDNASTDGTVRALESLAKEDRRVKVIVNNRNYGHIRSPYWGILQTDGDCTVYLASDLQDPPELIPEFIVAWEEGYKIALAVKPVSRTNPFMHVLRRTYYAILDHMTEIPLVKDSTGFGVYDREVIDTLRRINDPYPFLRGLICELGYEVKEISFEQPRRLRGISKNNIYSLYDIAWLGLVSHSLVPIRLASFIGILIGVMCLALSFAFIVMKIIWWDRFPLGIAPIIIGMFFMFGVVMTFIGVLGEYIGSILARLQNRPIVVERRRINF